MESEEWYQQIHNRLLERDPIASSGFVETVLDPLVETIRQKFPSLREPDDAVYAVNDALISYIERPEQFDPQKGQLFAFLVMAAKRDLLNIFDKANRRKKIEKVVDDVELDVVNGKQDNEEEKLVIRLDAQKIQKDVNELVEGPKDLQMLELIIDGERSTEAFAKILGLTNLPVAKQKLEVKRHKDRIKKKLQRYGVTIRDRE